MGARIERVELRRVALPLVTPFRTATIDLRERTVLLVRVWADGVEGWGECGALPEPGYTSEYVDGAHAVLRDHLVPLVLTAGAVDAAALDPVLAPVHGNPMAKAALELALLDAELRSADQSLAHRLGGVRERVACGVSVGRFAVEELLEHVGSYVDAGYQRVKLKILPGYDVDPVTAVRERFTDTDLWADANGSYAVDDVDTLRTLDEFHLGLLEQPLPDDDLLGNATMARSISTPVCLDESLTSARATQTAIELGACAIANVKPSRVGGFLEAARVHDVCVARGVPMWCGGMLESGIGRAANLALASLPGFTLPGDLSASDRYFARDVITQPFTLALDGTMAVPTGPGLGVDVDLEYLDAITLDREMLAS